MLVTEACFFAIGTIGTRRALDQLARAPLGRPRGEGSVCRASTAPPAEQWPSGTMAAFRVFQTFFLYVNLRKGKLDVKRSSAATAEEDDPPGDDAASVVSSAGSTPPGAVPGPRSPVSTWPASATTAATQAPHRVVSGGGGGGRRAFSSLAGLRGRECSSGNGASPGEILLLQPGGCGPNV